MNKKSTPEIYEKTRVYAQSDEIPLLQAYLEECLRKTIETVQDHRILRLQAFKRQYEPFRAEVEALAAKSRIEKILEAAIANNEAEADKQYGYLLTSISSAAPLHPQFKETIAPAYRKLDEVLEAVEKAIHSDNAKLALTLCKVGDYLAYKSGAASEVKQSIEEKKDRALLKYLRA
ncbi:MAG: hypothetical protein Q7S55_03895 [Nanoarchaeota archaeon]|nr:hypothetical protein [Nanoarchaeota archaeon]